MLIGTGSACSDLWSGWCKGFRMACLTSLATLLLQVCGCTCAHMRVERCMLPHACGQWVVLIFEADIQQLDHLVVHVGAQHLRMACIVLSHQSHASGAVEAIACRYLEQAYVALLQTRWYTAHATHPTALSFKGAGMLAWAARRNQNAHSRPWTRLNMHEACLIQSISHM